MSRYLDMVDSPDQVKKLTQDQLEELAAEIRQELIVGLSRNGGHVGPNLGVVELTLALHYVYSTPKDRFLWDVSHQTYVHKILTGRRDRFRTIRTTDGLNGFALRTESEHDCYGAGHAGTALSAALGMAVARDRRGSDENVVCVFGDAALTNGISFEALNNIAHSTPRFIGILNDNEWSIAKNVGAISKYLNKLITHPSYHRVHKDLEKWIKRMPKGEFAFKLGRKAEEALKGTITGVSLRQNIDTLSSDGRGGFGSSLIFEELGIQYLGPFDGHDLPLLINLLQYAKQCEHPLVLHIVTEKGRGFEAARKWPEKFHGTGPYDVETGASQPKSAVATPTFSQVFGQAMVRLCQQDSKVVGITAAMPSGTGLKALEKAMPERYFDVGIAEEHAVIFAAGMATSGYHPVCAIYSTFLQRAFDCIIHDVALQNLPVVFCMDRAGLSANDGPTHHGLFDIAYSRCVPNIIAMSPKDEDELVDMMFTATQLNQPSFIRYPRGAGEGVEIKDKPSLLEVGKAEVLSDFDDKGSQKIAVFGLGPMVSLARKTTEALRESGFDTALINARFTKPIDKELTGSYGRGADLVITIEDHVLPGGYGSSVLEFFNEQRIQVPVLCIAWPDQFIEHASSVSELRERYGLTVEAIHRQVLRSFSQCSKSNLPELASVSE